MASVKTREDYQVKNVLYKSFDFWCIYKDWEYIGTQDGQKQLKKEKSEQKISEEEKLSAIKGI